MDNVLFVECLSRLYKEHQLELDKLQALQEHGKLSADAVNEITGKGVQDVYDSGKQ